MMFNNLLRRYDSLSHIWPYATNAVTGFLIAYAGDYFSQTYFEKSNVDPVLKDRRSSSWDSIRSLEMGIIRAGIVTPFILFWF